MERVIAQLDKLDLKLDKMDGRIDSIDLIMDRNTRSLELHMLRTAALESIVEHNKLSADSVKLKVTSIFTVVAFIRWTVASGAVVGVLTYVAGMVLELVKRS